MEGSSKAHMTSGKRHPGHLIVACDRCRQKKQKCDVVQAYVGCESCVRAGVLCTFVDRQRYLADRESTIRAHVAETQGLTSSQLPSTSSNITSDIGSMSPGYWVSPTILFAPGITGSEPSPALMPQFIEQFFQDYPVASSFMSYEQTVTQFLNSALPVPLSTLIAALTVFRCGEPALSTLRGVNLREASEQYAEHARVHIATQWDVPSVVMMRSLILISWYETLKTNTSTAKSYLKKAHELGLFFHLDSEPTILSMTDKESERHLLRGLWMASQAGSP